jgi:hypothetical protein
MAPKILQKTCRKHNDVNAKKIVQKVAAYFFYEKIRPEIVIIKMIIMVTKMVTFLRAQKLSKILNKPNNL